VRKKHLLVLALAPLAAGCILTSGQITIDFEIPDTNVTAPTQVTARPVDLNTIGDYNDHKDKLKDIADVSILGEIVNNGTNPIQVEVWVTPDLGDLPLLTTADAVRGSLLARRLWGPFDLAAGPATSLRIDWDRSAELIDDAGLQLVLDEIRGDTSDGDFVLFVIGPAGATTYNFSVNDGFIVVTLDAGV
jgi:hypothetical protein